MTPTRSDINISARLTSISQVIAATAISVGVLVLIGWMLRLPGVTRIHPMLGTMGSHTALSFALAGTALLLSRDDLPYGWRRRAAQGLASLVVAMSWLTLSQWYGWGIGIDQFFQGTIGAMFPGRMPVATSLVFLAFGLALLLLDVEMGRWRPAEFLSFAASLIGLLAFIAYGYAFVSVFEISNRRSLAFHTVLLLLAFSFAVLAARPQRGLMSIATGSRISGVVVRRMLPAAVGIPVLMGWLIMDGQRGRLYPPALSLPYYTLSIIVIFSTLIWLTAASLQRIDIQRQKAEEQVRQLNAELEQRVVERTAQLESANRELEAFSYSVSHDLRAPLRAIDGFSSIVLQEHSEALGPTGKDHLQRVCAASRRMGQLIDDLLSLSRVTRNEMRRQTVDLSEMVEEIVADLRGREPERSVHVCIEPNLRADADPNLIRIVLENLLGNAWKFTRKKSDPRIEIGTVSHDGRNAFFVRDNGAGFDMAYADKLFAAFQRLHGPTDFEGTGIGLATVQRIIARHGGRVRAEGSVGQGATFYFSL